MFFLATAINYMDRQALSLTWETFLAPEYGWDQSDYGAITSIFSLVYAVSMLYAGKIVDWIGTKAGYTWALGIWTTGAVLHGFCGIMTSGIITGEWLVTFDGARESLYLIGMGGLSISTISIFLFCTCRVVLSIGQAFNFPSAVKGTAEYFPKKDRAFAISIFNTGASVGALISPLIIPHIARRIGWEWAFIAVGIIGYAWMFVWLKTFKKPSESPYVNTHELNYIEQDGQDDGETMSIHETLTYKQTWAVIVGKFMTDGVWWFFLFWTPAYITETFGYSTDSNMGMALISTLYLITMISIAGGYLPTLFVDHSRETPYQARMKAMFIYAIIPLGVIFAQAASTISPWLMITIVGLAGAAHQSWSANLYSIVGDLFPKKAIATVIGVGGAAGGIGSFILLQTTPILFKYAKATPNFEIFGYEGIDGAYMLIFCFCAVAYLIGWIIMKALVPTYHSVLEKM